MTRLGLGLWLCLGIGFGGALWGAEDAGATAASSSAAFPMALESYQDQALESIGQIIRHRIHRDPFNLAATLIFLCAVVHTFVAPRFHRHAQHLAAREKELLEQGVDPYGRERDKLRFKATLFNFLGEVEAVFGIWSLPLMAAIIYSRGYDTMVHYVAHTVRYTEPMFVVIIMAIASSRPILQLAETGLARLAAVGGSRPSAWWFSILTLGPILGSLITEPGAMTISAMLLTRQFYRLNPSPALKYGTLGLLFVNVSVGGTLSHFAAPPVLMVATRWQWDTAFMLAHFGWKTVLGILTSTVLYYFWFRHELGRLDSLQGGIGGTLLRMNGRIADETPMPPWLIVIHLVFLLWTVVNSHHPVMFVGGFLFYLALTEATSHYQEQTLIRSPLMVGFFLAGLVIHGGCQAWWIAPVLSSLTEWPLMIGSTILTSFNDNAAITYLSSLVPDFSPELKYAVVAGAVTGGGLTVIANAPNPAGQSILRDHFENDIAPARLFLGALPATLIMGASYMLLRAL